MKDHVHAVTIPPYVITNIAEKIYGAVDVFDYQDHGYMLKDVEMAVEAWLTQVVENICDEAEQLVLDYLYPKLKVRHHCDMAGCTALVRADGDIFCHKHGAEDVRHTAELQRAMADFEELPF